jgi:MoxR-like ATPase
LLDGRSFVIPDDVKRLVHPVFEHRLVIGRSGARGRARTAVDPRTVLAEIVLQTPIPA